MKNTDLFNLIVKSIAAGAYIVVGFYAGFMIEIDLGMMMGFQTHHLMGILFIAYGIFRAYRTYLFYKEISSQDYGKYEDEE